jgi:hypothetical protein
MAAFTVMHVALLVIFMLLALLLLLLVKFVLLCCKDAGQRLSISIPAVVALNKSVRLLCSYDAVRVL